MDKPATNGLVGAIDMDTSFVSGQALVVSVLDSILSLVRKLCMKSDDWIVWKNEKYDCCDCDEWCDTFGSKINILYASERRECDDLRLKSHVYFVWCK